MRKYGGNNRGETLVETMVAFTVLLIMLAMLGTVLRGAAKINQYAAQRAAVLEEDCTRVEQDMGRYDESTAARGTLTLTPQSPSVDPVSIQLDVRSCEILHYFSTATEGDGG